MNLEPTTPRKSPWKNPLLYMSLILACVALYVIYVFVARHESNLRYVQRTKERQSAQRREDDLRAVEQLGGSDLAIRGLYVSPSIINTGQSAQLCYDVANAKTVTLDPPVAAVWPSHSRCVSLSPKKSTAYTLSIKDAAGHTASQTVEIRVH